MLRSWQGWFDNRDKGIWIYYSDTLHVDEVGIIKYKSIMISQALGNFGGCFGALSTVNNDLFILKQVWLAKSIFY